VKHAIIAQEPQLEENDHVAVYVDELREYRKRFHLRFRRRGYNEAAPELGYDRNDFRPGAIPVRLVERSYGGHLRTAAIAGRASLGRLRRRLHHRSPREER
jgi:hypothetical protein